MTDVLTLAGGIVLGCLALLFILASLTTKPYAEGDCTLTFPAGNVWDCMKWLENHRKFYCSADFFKSTCEREEKEGRAKVEAEGVWK